MTQITLIDTHCHIHEPDYPDALATIIEAKSSGVEKYICVGTDLKTSQQAVEFAKKYKEYGVFAAVGIHPHEATSDKLDLSLAESTWQKLEELANEPEVVAIGEFGFDFFYHKPAEVLEGQLSLARMHLELAKKVSKPVILHIREAFEPFFDLISSYPEVSGVIHSFSDSASNVKKILSLPGNFMFGLNGIMTFTKDSGQLEAAQLIPLERLVLETDSPFLTPPPNRGRINTVKSVRAVAEFLAGLRGEDLALLAAATTNNAQKLFKI
jgi:TatD DNase family protein